MTIEDKINNILKKLNISKKNNEYFCPKCKKTYLNNEKYCQNCGCELEIKEKDYNILTHGDFKILLLNLLLLFVFPIIGNIIFYLLYENAFYNSEKFSKIKSRIQNYINDCNDLNDHIEELKNTYIKIKQNDYGVSNFSDTSKNNFKRPELNKNTASNNVYNCSSTICKNSQQQPFKYLCKYFNINESEETLEQFENILNDFEAAEQGKILLDTTQKELIESINDSIPLLIRIFGKNKLFNKLGLHRVDFSKLYFPRYIFQYVSAGGYSSLKNEIILDIDNLNKFVTYLSKQINFRKSVAGQRALMTSALREKIKERDNFTCQICGNSTIKEPNLLLEIDHIIPLSKNGQTTEDNLQTLCWKCNRTKGSKIIDSK